MKNIEADLKAQEVEVEVEKGINCNAPRLDMQHTLISHLFISELTETRPSDVSMFTSFHVTAL
jgi:hypothetical protein